MATTKQKRGKVIRISEFAWGFLNAKQDEGSIKQTVDGLINELHDLTVRLEDILRGKTYFVLPESLAVFEEEAEARGEAILRAVRRGKRNAVETPVVVKVI